jgi:putative membrane protein
MVDDHTKAGDELKSIASAKSVSLPADAPSPRMQALLTKLEKSEGAAFDRASVDDQIRDHEKTIALRA